MTWAPSEQGPREGSSLRRALPSVSENFGSHSALAFELLVLFQPSRVAESHRQLQRRGQFVGCDSMFVSVPGGPDLLQ